MLQTVYFFFFYSWQQIYLSFFFDINSSLRSMIWFHIFLIDILSNSFFSNTFKYLWNLLGIIFSTILISIKSSLSFSFSSIILTISIFSSTVSFLNSFFFFLNFFSFFSFCFCYSGFICLILHFFSHLSRHFIIFIFPVLQLTFSLYVSWKTTLLLPYDQSVFS